MGTCSMLNSYQQLSQFTSHLRESISPELKEVKDYSPFCLAQGLIQICINMYITIYIYNFVFVGLLQELNANRPPTPTRGRPQVANDRGSLAWIQLDSDLYRSISTRTPLQSRFVLTTRNSGCSVYSTYTGPKCFILAVRSFKAKNNEDTSSKSDG